MAYVKIEFVDDHGNHVEIAERSTVPLATSGIQAAQLAQEAFRKFLLVCGLGGQPQPAAEPDEQAETTTPATDKAAATTDKTTTKARPSDG